MKALVRDDVIKLERFVEARFHFDKFLEILDECGGYCFLDQISRYYDLTFVNRLKTSRLINIESFNNYKYVVLSDTASKYLRYKDVDDDLSTTKKDHLYAKKLRKNPSNKVLFTSAIKFEYFQKFPMRKDSAFKNAYLRHERIKLKTLYAYEDNQLNKANKELRELEEILNKNDVDFYNSLSNQQIGCDELIKVLKNVRREIATIEEDNANNLIKKHKKELGLLEQKEAELKNIISLFTSTNELIDEKIESHNSLVEQYRSQENKVMRMKEHNENIEKYIHKILRKLEKLHDISKVTIKIYEKKLDYNLLNEHERMTFQNSSLFEYRIFIYESGNTSFNSIFGFYFDISEMLKEKLYLFYRDENPDIRITYFSTKEDKKYTKKIEEYFNKQLRRINAQRTVFVENIVFNELNKYKKSYVDHNNYVKEKDLDQIIEIRKRISGI